MRFFFLLLWSCRALFVLTRIPHCFFRCSLGRSTNIPPRPVSLVITRAPQTVLPCHNPAACSARQARLGAPQMAPAKARRAREIGSASCRWRPQTQTQKCFAAAASDWLAQSSGSQRIAHGITLRCHIRHAARRGLASVLARAYGVPPARRIRRGGPRPALRPRPAKTGPCVGVRLLRASTHARTFCAEAAGYLYAPWACCSQLEEAGGRERRRDSSRSLRRGRAAALCHGRGAHMATGLAEACSGGDAQRWRTCARRRGGFSRGLCATSGRSRTPGSQSWNIYMSLQYGTAVIRTEATAARACAAPRTQRRCTPPTRASRRRPRRRARRGPSTTPAPCTARWAPRP